MSWPRRHSLTDGFAHPVETLLPLLVLAGLVYLLIHASNPARIAIVSVCGLFLLSSHILARLHALRVGDEVEVRQQGQHFARRGSIAEIVEMFFTVELPEEMDGDRILPRESLQLFRSDLKKLRRPRQATRPRPPVAPRRPLRSALSFYAWCWKHYAPWPWHERHGRVNGFGVFLFGWEALKDLWAGGERHCVEVAISYRYHVVEAIHTRTVREVHEERAPAPRYKKGDPVEVHYDPRDHGWAALAPDTRKLIAAGRRLLISGLACVGFAMLGAALTPRSAR